MPIEINQLHIKVNVNSEDKQAQLPTTGNAQKEREGLIAACVEAVIDVLERREMR